MAIGHAGVGGANPSVQAECLDAALAANWGPDDLDTRVELARRLDDVAAHDLDPDARLRARLWGLQVCCEVLDMAGVHRHMRALELLGEESPRALFYAASRRLMLDLLRGRTDAAPRLIDVVKDAARRAELADDWMVVASLRGYTAVQTGDAAVCADVAAGAEGFALAEGAPAVAAEAAYLWVGAGRNDRARSLLGTLQGRPLDDLPRDVNWLLTVQCVVQTALAVGERDLVAQAAALLDPYAGRAVINGGAVMFHGVTDDPLARAAAMLGDEAAARRYRERAAATYARLGASWWGKQLTAAFDESVQDVGRAGPRVGDAGLRGGGGGRTAVGTRLHPGPDGLWLIGPAQAPTPMRALRGYDYLRSVIRRPGQPVAALDLAAPDLGGLAQRGLGEVLDRAAVAAYRQRLRDLDEELAEAQDWSDSGRAARLAGERDALVHELVASHGLGGRPRTEAGAAGERARVAVTKAIRAAIERIAAVDPGLGSHLRAAVRTGTECCYQPSPGDERVWLLDG